MPAVISGEPIRMPNMSIARTTGWPAISLVFVFVALDAAPFAAGSAQAAKAGGPRVELVRHDAQQRVDVLVDGAPFTSYIWPSQIKKPVLYPIRAASGVIVTRGW